MVSHVPADFDQQRVPAVQDEQQQQEQQQQEKYSSLAAMFVAQQDRTSAPLSPEKEAEAVRMEKFLEKSLRQPTVTEARAGKTSHDYSVSAETSRRIRLGLRNCNVVGSAPSADGEESNDVDRMYPKGVSYEPALMREIFDFNEVTRAIFHAAEDFERPVAPVSILMETIMAVARRTGTNVSTSTGRGYQPHSIYTIHGGRSGTGKSNTQDVHPWYGTHQTIELVGGTTRTRSDFVYPKKGKDEDEKAWKKRCAEARSAYEQDMEEDERQNGPWEDRAEYPSSPQALAKMLTRVEIDEFGNQISKVHEQAVVPIYKDEMSAMLGEGNTNGGSNLVGWTAAFNSKDMSGTTGSRSANGRFTVTVSAGLQARLAGGIFAHRSLGAPQRFFFFADAMYPLKGLLGDVIPRPNEKVTRVLLPEWVCDHPDDIMSNKPVHYKWEEAVLDDIAQESSIGSQAIVSEDGISASQSLTVRIRIACCAAQLFQSTMMPPPSSLYEEIQRDDPLYRPEGATVTKKIWDWTGYLMEYHRRVVAMMEAEAEAEAARTEESEAHGAQRGNFQAAAKLAEQRAISEVSDEARKMWERIIGKYTAGDTVTYSWLNKGRSKKRDHAIAGLVQQGLLVQIPAGKGGGIRYSVVKTA